MKTEKCWSVQQDNATNLAVYLFTRYLKFFCDDIFLSLGSCFTCATYCTGNTSAIASCRAPFCHVVTAAYQIIVVSSQLCFLYEKHWRRERPQDQWEYLLVWNQDISLSCFIFSNEIYFVWYCVPGTKDNAKISNGIASASQGEEEASPRNPELTTVIVSNHLFVEKLVPVLVDLFLQAPPAEKYKILPDIIQSLGRWELIMYERSSSFRSCLSPKFDHEWRILLYLFPPSLKAAD